MSRKIIYLVRVEKLGECYWKIGSTNLEDPLSVDNKNFVECFRKDLLGDSSAREVLFAISLNIKNLTNLCMEEGFSLHTPIEGFSYDFPLELIEEIYDFWLELYQSPKDWNTCLRLLKLRRTIRTFKPILEKGLIGDTSKWAQSIEKLHSYRPNILVESSVIFEPMW